MTQSDAMQNGIFKNRGFLYYFGMNVSSRSAYQVVNVALIWVINAVTHSALDIAIVGVASTLSTLIMTLPGGLLADRVNRFKLLIAANAVNVVSILVLILAVHSFNLALIVGIVAIWAAASELYRSTSYSVLPDIVRSGNLNNANAITQSGYQVSYSASTLLGGILIVAIGVALTVVYGASGYILAAVFSGLMFLWVGKRASHERSIPNGRGNNPLKDIKEGFAWLLTQRGLLGLDLMALVTNFFAGIPLYFFVIYITEVLKDGALIYGGILTAIALGSASGSLLAGRFPKALAYVGKVTIVVWGVTVSIMLLILGLTSNTIFAFGAGLGIGLGIGFGNTFWLTAAHNTVPTEMRGRYFAIDGLISFMGGPPSVAVGGVLITFIGISRVFLLSGILLLISSVLFSFMRSLWKFDGRLKIDLTVDELT